MKLDYAMNSKLLLAIILSCCSLMMFAQEVEPAASDSYKLRKGDVVEIMVMEHPEFSIHNILILPDGKVQYPGLGSIQAAGLTVDEFTKVLNSVIEKYVVNPIVSVFVRNISNSVINVMGYVTRPGQVMLFEATDLVTVLSKAGGIKNVKKCKHITIIRADQSIEVLKVKDVFQTVRKNKRNNQQLELPVLNVGDSVYVVEPKEFNWARLTFFVSLAHVIAYIIFISG